MKSWIYSELRNKLLGTMDLQDETFITPSELIEYFNEGIEEAESEIHKIAEDYFLTFDWLPLVTGTADYPMPYNIYGNKIRGLIYANGSIIYPIKRIRTYNEFETLAYADQYGQPDDYRYIIRNPNPGNYVISLTPASRETAILSPQANTFTPVKRWYLRQANRIPILGEFIPSYSQFIPSAVDTTANTITIAKTYVTGDQVKITADFPSGTLPNPLVSGTTYYVISASATTIKLATSAVNAALGTAIDLTTAGSGTFTIAIAANQTIIDNTIVDIPEFTKFVQQWARCRCMEKEGDPRLDGAVATLGQQRAQMVSTLSEMVPDMDNEVQGDFSSYNELS